jgi:hypothetical protein
MRVTGPFENAVRGGVKPFAGLVREIENPSASSSLNGGQHHTPPGPQKSPPRLQVELVYQDETPSHDPFWDGPRLLPSFVAQVLGQVMAQTQSTVRVARTPYAGVAARQALLVDRKS